MRELHMPGVYPCDVIRLPLAMTGFSDIRHRGKIYVDKTALLARIARQDNPLFLSRPRRFGKSLLVDTLHSLFARGLEDFHGLAIAKEWTDTTYPVVHLDFSGMADSNPEELAYLLCSELTDQFYEGGIVSPLNIQYRHPNEILKKIGRRMQDNSVVLLIDEYDAPLTHHMHKPQELERITSILNNFYAVIKEFSRKFRFIFITGVTRAAHVSIFSAFNNLEDLSLKKEYNSLLGFTKEDIVRFFDLYMDNAAHVLDMHKNAVYTRLAQAYDGFQFSIDAEETLYNPWSILNFLKSPEDGFQTYWYDSAGISSLVANYLKVRDNFDFMNYRDRRIVTDKKRLAGRYELTSMPKEILLCQAGYLTIRKDTDGSLRLVPPNGEVEACLLDLYFTANNLEPQIALGSVINSIVEKINEHDVQGIARIFNAILNYVVSPKSTIFTDERAVRDTIFGSLQRVLNLQLFKEMESLDGYCDMELLTPRTHMAIEFKRTYPKAEKGAAPRDAKASLAAAIAQIESHRYGEAPFSVQTLFRVAMVISTEEKRILPVDMPYKDYYTVSFNIILPDGFSLEETPKPSLISFGDNDIVFNRKITTNKNILNIQYRFALNKTYYLANEYDELKKAFEIIAEQAYEIFVIKKI